MLSPVRRYGTRPTPPRCSKAPDPMIRARLPGVSTIACVWACISALACTRASVPPPAADGVAAPALSAAAAPPPTPAISMETPPSQPPVAATLTPSTGGPAPSSQPAAEDCSKFETSPESHDLSAEARARSLATCQAKEEFRLFVGTRQGCSSAAECTVVPGSCPFGCFVPAAKASASEVAAKLEALGARLAKAGNRCVYRCMSPPAATCTDGRCSTAAP